MTPFHFVALICCQIKPNDENHGGHFWITSHLLLGEQIIKSVYINRKKIKNSVCYFIKMWVGYQLKNILLVKYLLDFNLRVMNYFVNSD